jgi:23S rRNA (pseudouridine1915-N3)-methyltransferase
MKIRLLAVGHKMPKWVQQTFSDYNNRLPKVQQLELVEISPIHRSKTMNAQIAMEKEADNILASIKPNETLIVLDEKGRTITTQYLANSIKDWQLQGNDVALVIGGADGLTSEIKNKAQQLWSLSGLTFPHPLVRVIVMEQIYRAYSLIANHPYHRE